jgi:hypothetical protein
MPEPQIIIPVKSAASLRALHVAAVDVCKKSIIYIPASPDATDECSPPFAPARDLASNGTISKVAVDMLLCIVSRSLILMALI